MKQPENSPANAAPLGLCAFALTMFVHSVYLSGAGGVTNSNAGIGLALFYGGLIQLLAGISELKRGDMFQGTTFSSYGGYWLSFGLIHLDTAGIASSYKDDPEMLNHAVGIFLIGWTIFTFLMLLCVLRTNLVLIAIFTFLVIMGISLSISSFTGIKAYEVVGGIFGVLVSFLSWYMALSMLLNKQSSYFTLTTWPRQPSSFV